MIRTAWAFSSLAALALGAGVLAASRSSDMVDRVEGVAIRGRIPCDGATNPQEELQFQTTFSPGGWQRAFHLDTFASRYCKRLDLHFFCVFHGHDGWKHDWAGANGNAPASSRYWINTCSAWGSQDAPQYILSAWYQEGADNRKLPWKQAVLKQVSTTPEVYEFNDPQGGTARVEIKRK